MSTEEQHQSALTPSPVRVIVMGVAGCGKTTVGQELAASLGGDFTDGDAFHSAENIAKMSAGSPLDDADREPWLETIGAELALARATNRTLVIGCSALKRRYRDIIRGADPQAVFVHLHGTRDLLAQRLTARPGHFMPPSLLDSQLEALEMLHPDETGRVFDISSPIEAVVRSARSWLASSLG